MKILLIGASGTIGRHVSSRLSPKHQIITAGRNSGDVQVEIAEPTSIQSMFATVGEIDAMVNISGEAKWAPFADLSEEDYYIGLRSKLMGQVNLVRIGMDYVRPGGSFTLSTGILADEPVLNTTSAAMVNGGLHSFAQAAALEMTEGRRINVVSLGLVEDSVEKYADYFPGHNPIPMWKAANAYLKCVEGKDNGRIIRYYDNG